MSVCLCVSAGFNSAIVAVPPSRYIATAADLICTTTRLSVKFSRVGRVHALKD